MPLLHEPICHRRSALVLLGRLGHRQSNLFHNYQIEDFQKKVASYPGQYEYEYMSIYP
jgi:hypothetical protein